jgi:transcriptional regulator
MFVRPCWGPRSVEEMFRLVDDHPWALLVSNSDEGPLVTNLPLLLDRSRGGNGVLVGHLARANDHARALQATASAPTMAVFHGPSSYVTPSWYPGRDMPGTFYYMAAHCYGRVRLQSETELEQSLEILNRRMEAQVEDGWNMDEIPYSEIMRRLPAIMGFELEIDRIEGKFKLGQDEPRAAAMAVAERLAASDDAEQRALGQAVRHANEGRPESEIGEEPLPEAKP